MRKKCSQTPDGGWFIDNPVARVTDWVCGGVPA